MYSFVQIDRGQYGGYRDGVDQGIEALAGQVEDGIHGWGHMTLAAMTGRARRVIGKVLVMPAWA